MMINVHGSITAINELSKHFKNDQKGQLKDFSLNISTDLNELSEKGSGDISIHLINQDQNAGLYSHLESKEEISAMTLVDNGSSPEIHTLLQNDHHIARVLGIQSHCYQGDINDLDSERVFRLYQLRDNIDLSEIVLRTSDIAVFNMNAIRRGDQCTYLRSNTTGLSIEEACLIAKYIGASQLINEVYFTGLNFNDDTYGMMTTNLVNLLWYFAEGLKFRDLDSDINDPENLVFSIVADDIDQELQFVQSTDSGRWWLKVPTETGNDLHMACSHKDYVDARNNEFSDRILNAIATKI